MSVAVRVPSPVRGGVAVVVMAVALPAGCAFDPTGPGGRGSPGDGDGVADGSPGDGQGAGADATVADAAGLADAAADGGPDFCHGADEDTIALYRFDSPLDVSDETGEHDGLALGLPLLSPEGLPGCGLAAGLPEGGATIITVADSPGFDLAIGSVDLLVRPTPHGVERGLISRDANDENEPGHLTLVLDSEGRFVTRIQTSVGADAILCSDALAVPGQWHRIGINFGPPEAEIFVDGVRGTTGQEVTILGGQTLSCNTRHAEGIAGNSAAWVMGADNSPSLDGQVNAPRNFFEGGEIDEVRISSVRRDFAAAR